MKTPGAGRKGAERGRTPDPPRLRAPLRPLSPAWALVPALVAFAARLPALGGTWVWDDLLIVHNQLRAFGSLASVFLPPPGIPNFSVHYYRPLTIVSYLADQGLYGARPWGFHLTVLLAHAGVAGALFLLLRRLLPGREGRLAACIGATLFAVHPVHTESVAWIAGRADVLAALALLGCSLALLTSRGRIAVLGLSVALFAGACLFKEVGWVFLAFVPLLAAHGDREGTGSAAGPGGGPVPREMVAPMALFGVAAAGLLALRWAALGGMGTDAVRTGGVGGALERLGGALAFAFGAALFPLRPAPYVDRLPSGPVAWMGLGAGILTGLLGAILVRRGAPIVGWGLLSFLAFLGPSLVPAIQQVSVVPAAERYLYVPTIGLAVAAAGGLAILLGRFPRARRPAILATAIVVLVLGAVCWKRSELWRDDLSLWTAAARASDAPAVRIHLATALADAGRREEAKALYGALIASAGTIEPQRLALARMNLGVLQSLDGDAAEARRSFEEAVRLDPSSALGWFNLAGALWDSGWIDPARGTADRGVLGRALDASRRASALSPLDPRILLLRARIEGAFGNEAEARVLLAEASRLDPDGAAGEEARRLLGVIGTVGKGGGGPRSPGGV